MKPTQPRATSTSQRLREFVQFTCGAIIVFFVLVVAIVLFLNPFRHRWS